MEQSIGLKEEWQRDKNDMISVPLLVSEAAETGSSPFFMFEPSGIGDEKKGFLLGKNFPF
ncbi:MAG: hypothetical protein GY820_30380 [Gammaproteobacteria bacterium]|nr:hypothetical protein [Gammaproteobacteria bacterium]